MTSTPMRTWIAALVAAVVLVLAPATAQQTQQTQAPAAAPASEETQAAPAASNGTKPAPAGEVPPQIAQQITRLSASVEAAEKSLERIRDSDSDLARVRSEIDQALAETAKIAEQVRPLLAAARRQIESLGPQPAKDAPPEAPAIAAERERLGTVVSALDGALKTVDLTEIRARELINRITELRQSLFSRNLFERAQSPLLPYHWRLAGRDLPTTIEFAHYLATDWLKAATDAMPWLISVLAAAGVAFAGLWFGVRYLERMTHSPPPEGRNFIQRAQRIAWIAPARMLPALAALAIIFGGLNYLDLMRLPGGHVVTAILAAVLLTVIVGTLIRVVLSPRDPALRMTNLTDRAASRISWCLIGLVAVYAADLALADIGRALVVPLSITVVRTFVASLAYAGLLTGLLLTPFTPQPVPTATSEAVMLPVTTRLTPWWLKLPLWALTILILATTLLGYLALGRFIAQQLVLTGTVVVAAGVIYLTIRSIMRTIDQPDNPIGYMMTTRLRAEPSRLSELAWLAEVLLTFILLAIAVPLVLVQWGFTAADIRDWFARAFFGFEIGQLRISPARIVFGILLFIALIFATRVFQRWLRERVLAPRRVEAGIANSIETTVGYSGIALSAIIAVSYAGLDITNIAIVAGALSVGIGFGLQSIVNNFVSGLIVLVERPVKVGDRIVVGDQEGHVRRISVRSTEIETFDRARLIIPNSELIIGRVINKTHRSLIGRGSVRIGANYGADPERVIAIIVSCAKAHPQVLTEPPPGAVFDNFGASSLDFFMWFFVADVSRAAIVQSDLRIAIMKAFKEAGIEIPFAQHDIHLRDLDGVRTLINRAVEERAAKAQGASGTPDRTAAEEVEEAPGEREPPPEAPPSRGG
jgi:potassium-dependent mechanosensitive channel